MKLQQSTTSEPTGPSLGEMGRWRESLLHLHQRLSPRFARPEVRQHALLSLQAIDAATSPEKMAGRSLNRPDKHGPTGCSACSRKPSGMKKASAMICVHWS